jgi:hypothetical protein
MLEIHKFSDISYTISYKVGGAPLDLTTKSAYIVDSNIYGLDCQKVGNNVILTLSASNTCALKVGGNYHLRLVLKDGGKATSTARIPCVVI